MSFVGYAAFFLADWLIDYAHDVGLLHDKEFLSIDLDLSARPFAETGRRRVKTGENSKPPNGEDSPAA
jgi:hypothetical protein